LTATTAADSPLRAEYRYIQALTCKGNRRVRIDPDGRVFADVATRDCAGGEDWNGPWPMEPVRTLSEAELARLRREFLDSGFFDLPARLEVPAHDGYRDEIDLSIGPRSHSVTVQHAPAPSAFVRVRAALLAAAGMR
jgi:hypothetical protein